MSFSFDHCDKQSMQWSKVKDKKTNNAMVKRKRYKDKQCNGQKFLLTIALFVFMSFSFDHCIVCLYVFFF
jgi:hypothetical protein